MLAKVTPISKAASKAQVYARRKAASLVGTKELARKHAAVIDKILASNGDVIMRDAALMTAARLLRSLAK